MGALIGQFIKIALQILAGVGIGKLVDKVAADKVPNYEPVSIGLFPGEGFKPLKLVFTVVAFAIGAMVLIFVGRKFKIKLLK